MRMLKAIKSHKYGTRQLTAGEEYEAPDRHALVLVAANKARFIDRPFRAAARALAVPQPEAKPEPEPPSLDSLRLEATQLGINVDGRWGTARLQHEIAQARQR